MIRKGERKATFPPLLYSLNMLLRKLNDFKISRVVVWSRRNKITHSHDLWEKKKSRPPETT